MIQNQPSEIIEVFINHIKAYDSRERRLLLRLLELELEQMSREAECPLLSEHAATLEERNRSSGEEREKLTYKLHALDNSISTVALRLEHFVREMGQMYEAVVQCTQDYKRQNRNSTYMKYSSLPDIASKILLDGYSLEILDGDLGGVAVVWIQEVLKSTLAQLQENEEKSQINVNVVSAVGLQSSGKSTFLNSMFDTHFAVGAGKATRGVHMQLVKVRDDLRKEIKVDYIIAVDTEGLGSPDSLAISSHKRDNQILTFVTALSNITMISLMGEHTGHFDEILPICMHAFIRMKLTHNYPACKLVHQNVDPVDARKLQTQSGILVTKLDQAFKAACIIEKIPDKERRYQDVVRFSVPEDIHYVPYFTTGAMDSEARSNAYITHIQCLKSRLLAKTEISRAPSYSLGVFSERIKQVWEAVISEDFVFEFRNVTEILARDKLDETWSTISWDLSKITESYGLRACSQIENSVEKEQLDRALVEQIDMLNICIKEESTKRVKELASIFESPQNMYREVQKQWKSGMFSKFAELTEILRKEHEQILRNCCVNQQLKIEVLERNKIYKTKMITFIKTLVKGESIQHGVSEHDGKKDMELIFERHWVSWVDTLVREFSESCKTCEVEVNIPDDALHYLREQYLSHKAELENKIENTVFGQVEDLQNNPIIYRPTDDLKLVLKGLASRMPDLFGKLDVFPKMYTSAQMRTAVKHSKDCIEDIFDTRVDTTIEDQICLAISACDIAVQKLQQRHAAFVQTYKVKNIIGKEKTQYFNLFCTIYDIENSLKYIQQELGKALQDGIATVVKKISSVAIADAIKNTSHRQPLASKQHFLFSILIEMSTPEDCFSDLFQYIKQPQIVAKKVLSGYVNSIVPYIKFIVSSLVIDQIDQITTLLDKITKAKPRASNNLKTWISLFQHEYSKVIPLPDISHVLAVNAETLDNCDLEHFSQEMKDLLRKADKTLSGKIMGDLDYLSVVTDDAESQLYKAVVGCDAQCPFCGEVCVHTYHADDDHFTPLHRPQGLSGIKNYVSGCLVITNCNTDIVSNKKFKTDETADRWVEYKQYKTVDGYKTWNIPASSSSGSDASTFWRWFYKEYSAELAAKYELKEPPLPRMWTFLGKQEVISTLKKFVFPDGKRLVEAGGEFYRKLSENAKQEFMKFCKAVRDDTQT